MQEQNGYVESASREAESFTRALVYRTTVLHKAKFQVAQPQVMWAIRYSDRLLSRPQWSGDDGMIDFERRKGRP